MMDPETPLKITLERKSKKDGENNWKLILKNNK